MKPPSRQRGAAIFVAIFLITVVVLAAAIVALTSVTQHIGQARAGQAEQAWYVAIGRIELETQNIVTGAGCAHSDETINGFNVEVSCDDLSMVSESDEDYAIHTVTVLARQGTAESALFVRRSVTAQIWTESP